MSMINRRIRRPSLSTDSSRDAQISSVMSAFSDRLPSLRFQHLESTPVVSTDSSRDAQIDRGAMSSLSDSSRARASSVHDENLWIFDNAAADDDGMDEDEAPNNQPSKAGDHKIHTSTSASRQDSNIVITLTESGLLDCPICCEPLTVPVYQCDQNGHIACSSCRTKVNYKCPFCSCPFGSGRCRAIEKIVESSTTQCKNIKYGCNIPVTYNTKNDHEMTCVCSPCSCPYSGCKFVSSAEELYKHFSKEHFDLLTGKATGILYVNFEYDVSFPITLKKNDRFVIV